MPEIPELDPVVHAPLRLAVLTILSRLEQAEFAYLKEFTEATDGNLSVHLGRLEKAGYVKSKKQFVSRKPQTTYRLTTEGRDALLSYVRDMKKLLAFKPTLSAR